MAGVSLADTADLMGHKDLATTQIYARVAGASVINCYYTARAIRVSSTPTKTVDCPNLPFSDNQRNIAGGKTSLNLSRRVISPACIAGVLISPFLVKLESVRRDQRGTFKIHSAGYVVKDGERISVAPSPYDSRRPERRPDINRGEEPDRMFFVADDRNLVCLKLRNGECRGVFFAS
jgi:hypothetical protein